MSVTTDPSEPETKPQQIMYMREIELKNFRSCVNTVVRLQPELTLIVGENNAGKSNIIEALRLATTPLSRRRTRYFELDDVSKIASEDKIEIRTTYDGLSEFQQAQYICAVNTEDKMATYRTTYLPDRINKRKSRVEHAAGRHGATDPEPEKRDQINHVYLAPLRDANRELDSATGNRLALIMDTILDKADMDSLLKDAGDSYKELNNHPSIKTTKEALQGELTLLTDAARKQHVNIAFDAVIIERLTRSLRLKMSEHEVDVSDLANSGLGYANLLFLASVVLELSTVDVSELTLFLVEEPEAHLHPQLQAVLLDYLQDQARKSVKNDESGPAGRIQVVATTHSPNLASSAGITAVVVAQSHEEKSADGSLAQQSTKCLALSELDLEDTEHRKIDQYLDVTRAELLFARNVILVEGIAEQVVIPALARSVVLVGDEERDRQLRRRFRGVSIISVGSVDFKPYIKLLLQEVNGCRLAERVAIVTDGDPDIVVEKVVASVAQEDGEPQQNAADVAVVDDEDDENEEVEDVTYNRTDELNALLAELNAAEFAHVATAPHTLEADLLTPSPSNLTALKKAFLSQKTRSAKKWTAITGSDDPSQEMYERLRKNKKFLSKGQFAHDFAYNLEKNPEGYVVPEYLETAIKYLVADRSQADE